MNPFTTGRVTNDLPCVRCGYNLRTLAIDAVCPECGHSVGRSARTFRKRRRRRLWLSPWFAVVVAGWCAVIHFLLWVVAVFFGSAGLVYVLVLPVLWLLAVTGGRISDTVLVFPPFSCIVFGAGVLIIHLAVIAVWRGVSNVRRKRTVD